MRQSASCIVGTSLIAFLNPYGFLRDSQLLMELLLKTFDFIGTH